MVDDELSTVLEQVAKGDPALGGVDLVLLFALDHRKRAPRGDQRVSLPLVLLFLRKELEPGLGPRVTRYDFRLGHGALLLILDADERRSSWVERVGPKW